jgi:hypothetical protein
MIHYFVEAITGPQQLRAVAVFEFVRFLIEITVMPLN